MTSSDPRNSEGLAAGDGPAQDGPARTEADSIHTAVLGCADVAGLSAGAFGEVASYLPGRKVPGVRIDDNQVEVHIVARYGQPLLAIVDQISVAVAPWLAGRRLQVAVTDILLPGEALDQEDSAASESQPPVGPPPAAG